MNMDSIFEADESRVAEDAPSLPRSGRSLLRLFDGNRTLAAVIAASPLRPADTLDAVAWLGSKGLIRRRD